MEFEPEHLFRKSFHTQIKPKQNTQRELRRVNSAEAIHESLGTNRIEIEAVPSQVVVNLPPGPTTEHHGNDIANQRSTRALRRLSSNEAVEQFIQGL